MPTGTLFRCWFFWYLFITPRHAGIDAPGSLQHIIIRGIERRAIFKIDADRDDFIDRLGNLLQEMCPQGRCFVVDL
jgi:hypothetical protein